MTAFGTRKDRRVYPKRGPGRITYRVSDSADMRPPKPPSQGLYAPAGSQPCSVCGEPTELRVRGIAVCKPCWDSL